MEELALIIMIIVILGLISILSYFVYVYMQDNDALNAQITNANVRIENEQSNRLSNIKYVVDQVNTVNSDISTQFTSTNDKIFKSLNDTNAAITTNLNLQNTQYSGLNKSVVGLQSNVISNTSNINNMNAGFGQYITFGSPQGTNAYNLLNLPSSSPPNMNLMSQVNLMMGMTAQNLSPIGGSNINFCYGPDNKNCISFPNAEGNTLISAPALNKDNKPGTIILNGPTKICDNSTPQKCATLTIDSTTGNLVIDRQVEMRESNDTSGSSLMPKFDWSYSRPPNFDSNVQK